MPLCVIIQGEMDKIRVLVADDHPVFRTGLLRLLELAGDIECVAVAGNGEEAIKLAIDTKPDVAIIDAYMPGAMGMEAAARIKASCSETAVLMLSAFNYDQYLVDCVEAGVDGYLLKTASPSELIEAIHSVHLGNAVFNGDAAVRVLKRIVSGSSQGIPSHGKLSEREIQILKLVAEGMTNKQISTALSLSGHTIGNHLINIFRKLDVVSRAEAVAQALRSGYVNVDDLPLKK